MEIIMGLIMWLSVMIPISIVLIKMVQKRRTYKNANWSDPFFFENGKFVINSGFPREYAIDRIDFIEIEYQEILSKYTIWMRVVYIDGTRDQHISYRGSILRRRLEYFQEELERNGVRYIMG